MDKGKGNAPAARGARDLTCSKSVKPEKTSKLRMKALNTYSSVTSCIQEFRISCLTSKGCYDVDTATV